MVKRFEYRIVQIIFAILLILLILQHHYVYMYFDDYGHASLSYGHLVSGVKGTNMNFKDLLEWTSWYYLNWGGRVVYYFLFLVPLLSKSIALFMFIQAIIFFFIFVYLYKIIQSFNEQFNPILTILSLITLYGLIPIELLKESAYWASASVCYIWSLLPLLMGIYYYMQATKKKSKSKIREIILIPILFFFASSSFEQSGAATLIFVLLYAIYLLIKRNHSYIKLSILNLIASLAGVLIQYLSPGNKKRILETNPDFASMPVWEKMKSGIPNVVHFIFDPRISIFILILCILSISILVLLFKNNKSLKKYHFVISIPIVLPVFYLIKNYFNFGISGFFELLLLVIIFFYFLLFMNQNKEFLPLVFTVAASIFCLVISPVLQLRSLVFFLILLFILIIIVLNSIFISLKNNSQNIFVVISIVFIAFSFNNYKNTFLGYKENYSYAISNHEKLLSLSKSGSSRKIQLFKYPNDLYREHMPYDETTPFVSKWIIQYYNLPENTQIEWIDKK